ncbi:MAG: deoxynucleoside kinase [Calditrichaeota bacterium]|nr:deoxynucleoside kinase [Calditrichota bacterium]MCB0269827.1 deoxynucleoside kinase [Calditrichota bacterium]MCB0287370.1 deoxynucleoside kinase [Calditrichota bacterium]MCB0301409.1 deoxynucleoside kinase [Calditrichota bacterium]MCB9069458.1 deoxynucleoside kinase [Calditrichia bacterium]
MSSKKPYLIGIAGNIGVGKTTVTTKMAEKLGWQPYFESVIDNPYLDDFYKDMKRWGFNLQIYFLAHRFKSQKEIMEAGQHAIQDRTIYEDVEIFARSLYEQGNINDRDYSTYRDLFYNMVPYLPKPDVIIYLRASVDTLMHRISLRGRDFEQSIPRDYITYLNHAYERWMNEAKKEFSVLEINADETDYVNGDNDLDALIEQIRRYCP